ncbi:MAG: 30S ribosomal protein S2 [Planctomycetes bacterium]|nr:30S ribosomal protein S2 [Planctomycetota bacterium]
MPLGDGCVTLRKGKTYGAENPLRLGFQRGEQGVVTTTVRELLDAGIHYGHRVSRWNPKMRSYIYGRRRLIHIIDVRQTLRGLLRAKRYLSRVASQGSLILLVGTKRQAAETVEREAQRCGMPYVNQRWLGGTLTNFRTVRSQLRRLEELEQIETSGTLASYSKKMQASLMRERRKIYRNLAGIRDMNRLPEALIVVDPRREHLAVREAGKLGIPTVALIDTDSDPDLVDLPIPGNDDSIRSVELIVRELTDAILEGKASLPPEAGSAGPIPTPAPPVVGAEVPAVQAEMAAP